VGTLAAVNLAVPHPDASDSRELTGIDKHPTTRPVQVSAPAAKGMGGLAGDTICSSVHHGGPDQAVYAYAREDLDAWATELGRPLRDGTFGENLTTAGIDVTGALIGERWRIGDTVELEVTYPRIPCNTFAQWMAERGWVKRFTAKATPGAYLRVVVPGEIRVGDPVVVVHRPDHHDVTIGEAFRALTLAPELLPRVFAAEPLPDKLRQNALRRSGQRPE
jgi:MOSC domain-containing protein YiiM